MVWPEWGSECVTVCAWPGEATSLLHKYCSATGHVSIQAAAIPNGGQHSLNPNRPPLLNISWWTRAGASQGQV